MTHLCVYHLPFAILWCFVLAHIPQSGGQKLQSVRDLEAAVYEEVEGSPCVRVLSLTGQIGCANPGRFPVSAPVQRLTAVTQPFGSPRALLLPADIFPDFLLRVLENATLGSQVAGVLVEHSLSGSFSSAEKFPQAAFAPYADVAYPWNPEGTGLARHAFPFPIFLLSQASTLIYQERAAANERAAFQHPVHVAEFDLVMQTTKSETGTTEACLQSYTCLPIGGYSVWSAMPPLNLGTTAGATAAAVAPKEVVVAVAAMDAAAFFRDVAPAADSPLSGLVALLAAADALSSSVPSLQSLPKQLVFLALTGEAWGYLGSRQFLRQLAANGSSVAGLDPALLRQVLEVGSVGRAARGTGSGSPQATTFYAHSHKPQVAPGTEDIIQRLQAAADSMKPPRGSQQDRAVRVQRASSATPGVPPSSLMSFINHNAATAGVVLEEFDAHFTNSAYDSRFDDLANVDAEAVASAATLTARTLFLLAGGSQQEAGGIEANATLVSELLGCLVAADPGMTCRLVSDLITPKARRANHYAGVFIGAPSANPPPEAVDDTARFVWNFLATRTQIRPQGPPGESGSSRASGGGTDANFDGEGGSSGKGAQQSSEVGAVDGAEMGGPCADTCQAEDQVCVGSKAEQKGVCVVSTTRYVPAYSPRLAYDEAGSSGWHLLPPKEGDKMDAADPVWTESFWQTLGLRAYLQDSPSLGVALLLAGLCATFGTLVMAMSAKAMYHKRLKNA